MLNCVRKCEKQRNYCNIICGQSCTRNGRKKLKRNVMLTLNDVTERLKQQGEIPLLEILDISAEDIVERFRDRIEDNYEVLAVELEDDDYDVL